MTYLDEQYQTFQDQIESIFQLSKVPDEIIRLAQGSLDIVEVEVSKIDGYLPIKEKVHRQTDLLATLRKSPALNDNFARFYNQIIVLMIGALEAHLYDLVASIANQNPEIYTFQDKKKISFDPAILQEGTTVGDLMRYYFKELDTTVSFQDLQSTLKFFNDYLGIDIDLDDGNKDVLIFSAACRHISVHNNSVIDRGFLAQIRNTRYITLKAEDEKGKNVLIYQSGRDLAVTAQDVGSLKETVTAFSADLIALIEDRIKDES